jgi:hypothetical protein
MTALDRTDSTLTTQELERLAAYRGAVAAGIFSDWDGSTTALDTETLVRLLEAPAAAESESLPFTARELEQLERCRQAVAAGYYSEEYDAPRQR